MNIKAYNGRCVAEWLAHSLRSAASQPEMYKEERLPLAALAMWLGAWNSNIEFKQVGSLKILC